MSTSWEFSRLSRLSRLSRDTEGFCKDAVLAKGTNCVCSGEIDGVREDTVLVTLFVMLLVLVRILFIILFVIVFRISGLFEGTVEDGVLVVF